MAREHFRILFVCTGNICRSPLAEGLARQALASSSHPESDRVVVESAGVHGFDNASMDPYAADELRQLGGDSEPLRSRRLTASMVKEADLVLTAGREHRADVLSLDPRALSRCFTLLEFSRLVGHINPDEVRADGLVEHARSLVSAAAGQRGQLAPVPPGDDDVPDPFGGPANSFQICAERIHDAVAWVGALANDTRGSRADA